MPRKPPHRAGAPLLGVLLAATFASGCGATVASGAASGNDGGPPDAPGNDAGRLDASGFDAPVARDAPSLDGAGTDPDAGPAIDAPGPGGGCGSLQVPGWTGTEAGIAAVDAQGRLLVVVHAKPTSTSADTYALQRRTAASTVDPTFGAQGVVPLTGTPLDLAVGPTGTIVVVLGGDKGAESLLALDSTGAPLAGFDATAAINSMGLLTVPQSPWYGNGYDIASYRAKQASLAFLPGGELLVATLAPGGNGTATVARLRPDGSLDSAFGATGYLTVAGSFACDLALLPSGDFVLVTQDDVKSTITATWYSSAGVARGPTASILFNSYDGILTRSDGSILLGSAIGITTTFTAYSATGSVIAGEAPQILTMDHRFIGPMDALTYLPGASAAISVYATLPDGVAGPEIQATCAVPAGQYVRFLDGIADGAGGVFLVGETCGSATAGCTLPCTTLVVQVSSSGGVTQ